VILTIPQNAIGLRQVIAELVARLHRPFILLLPTTQFVTAASQELLGRSGAEFFALADSLRIGFNGRLEPVRPPGELFAQFTPQPIHGEENVAQRAFDLLRQLEQSDSRDKPPTVLQVFRQFCVEGASIERIMHKHDCSRMTVVRRLKQVEVQTKMPAARLRALSLDSGGHERTGVSDSRARRIDRRRLIDENEALGEG
jgi:hypothetical protein